MKFEQVLVRTSEFRLATSQGSQIRFCLTALRFDKGLGEIIKQLLTDGTQRWSLPQELAQLDLRCLSRPGKKIAAKPKRLKFTPENQAHGLVQVVGVLPIPDYPKDVAIDLALAASQQLRKQCMTFLFVHQPIPESSKARAVH
jgi:hypothetical protein